MIDKHLCKTKLIHQIKGDIEKQKASYEHARLTSIESPCRMQSRYDTTGIEAAWVADGLARALAEKETNLAYLESFHLPESWARICPGSIVGITSSDSQEIEYYFLLPVFSGYELRENDSAVATLGTETPLGKVLVGRYVGEKIKVDFPRPRTIAIEVVL